MGGFDTLNEEESMKQYGLGFGKAYPVTAYFGQRPLQQLRQTGPHLDWRDRLEMFASGAFNAVASPAQKAAFSAAADTSIGRLKEKSYYEDLKRKAAEARRQAELTRRLLGLDRLRPSQTTEPFYEQD